MGTNCEHCHSPQQTSLSKMAGLTLILGLGLSACGEKEDTGEDLEAEETGEPITEPMYGVSA